MPPVVGERISQAITEQNLDSGQKLNSTESEIYLFSFPLCIYFVSNF